MTATAKRRRRDIYINGLTVTRLLIVLITSCALFGAVLGDIWLWRLLYA